MRSFGRTSVLLVFVLIGTVALFSQAANPLTGTWKLNVAKSKFSPPELMPKSAVSKFEVTQDGINSASDAVNSKGQATHAEYAVKFDGKDYPWKGTIDGKPNPEQDMIACKKIDDYTYDFTSKLKGQIISTSRIVVARDGKTRTNSGKGKNAQGQEISWTYLYEKQ